MLVLKKVSKTYGTGGAEVKALKEVSLNFRESEFVSILGASGCGKTTLLNIIGGLDKYTSGDLVIDGKSTKNFSDRDWDTYRNHKIGFVFQSYNLIHHLSVLENVEMALTLNGISKSECKTRAVEALKKVGLETQINKLPNQLSGGQMQRVAIARAIVNNPKIILADEPTGALDTKTSVQIMDLLKEISKDKLIVMVTHNPKLAKKYSTRIIKLVDGEVAGDNDPFEVQNEKTCGEATHKTVESEKTSVEKKAKERKTSMSFFTALYLSLKNMLHKKGRTFLTSFAGSIGIIGVALVLAISNGFTNYINSSQSSALSGYPVTVSTATIDYSSFTKKPEQGEEPTEKTDVSIYESSMEQYTEYGHFNYLKPEFVQEVRDYEAKDKAKQKRDLRLVQYNYFTPLKVMAKKDDGTYGISTNKNSLSILSGSGRGTFYEAINDNDFIDENYESVYQTADFDLQNEYEMTLVLEKGNRLKKSILDDLGISLTRDATTGKYANISYEDLCKKEYKLVFNNDFYFYDAENNTFSTILSADQAKLEEVYNSDTTKTLKITRILRKKEDANTSLLASGVMFSPKLASDYRDNCKNSLIAQKQAELKQSEVDLNSDNYTFCAPFEIYIAEFAGIIPSSFDGTQQINGFLNSTFKLQISSEEAYELGMQQIGVSNIPQNIVFYANNFDAKTDVVNFIADYNATVDDAHQIVYSDQGDAVMKTLNNIINIVSYVLIAFASISLVVSSIMIGIITYVSVIERTKEIGILRSLGARKKDISRVFNAETIIIGFMAGFIGVAISYIFCPIISAIVKNVADNAVSNIAVLNPLHALILIATSMLLTLVSGSIPSKIASKKDPVECLRTEW